MDQYKAKPSASMLSDMKPGRSSDNLHTQAKHIPANAVGDSVPPSALDAHSMPAADEQDDFVSVEQASHVEPEQMEHQPLAVDQDARRMRPDSAVERKSAMPHQALFAEPVPAVLAGRLGRGLLLESVPDRSKPQRVLAGQAT